MRTRSQAPVEQTAPPTSEVGLRAAPDFIREIEDLPAQLLPGLPLAVTLWLEVPGAPVPVCFTTAQVAATDATEPVLGPRIVFDRDELAAIVLGVEADRMWRRELLGACFEKWRKPARRFSVTDTLAGAMPDEAEQTWTVGRVLRRLGVELVRVELPGDRDSSKLLRERRRLRVAA